MFLLEWFTYASGDMTPNVRSLRRSGQVSAKGIDGKRKRPYTVGAVWVCGVEAFVVVRWEWDSGQ